MTKIRCGDSLGVDLDKVVAWSKGQRRNYEGTTELLLLYFAGADDGFFCVSRSAVGCQAFARLHKLLLDRFAIDLACDNNLSASKEDEPLELPF